MQKYHDEPKQYKGYLKSALVVDGGLWLASSRMAEAWAEGVASLET